MSDILYFVPGNNERYINKNWKSKITIGNKISKEGYYIGTAKERERCWIFYGKPYIPTDTDVPSKVDFDPSPYRAGIDQDSIQYFLVRHKKSDAYFVICSYLLDRRYPIYRERHFSELLTFIDGKWVIIRETPIDSDRRHTNDKILEYWRKYGNYYEVDFELIREINSS